MSLESDGGENKYAKIVDEINASTSMTATYRDTPHTILIKLCKLECIGVANREGGRLGVIYSADFVEGVSLSATLKRLVVDVLDRYLDTGDITLPKALNVKYNGVRYRNFNAKVSALNPLKKRAAWASRKTKKVATVKEENPAPAPTLRRARAKRTELTGEI